MSTAPQPMPWRVATVEDGWLETRTARTVALDVPGWPGHDAGQHVDVRLTAADGYTATRTYSVASAPETGRLVLTVQLVGDGEVSPWLVEEARAGDLLERDTDVVERLHDVTRFVDVLRQGRMSGAVR